MQRLLLLMAFLLAPKTQAGQIIGGHEAKPHSHPYMAFLRIRTLKTKRCGGFLVRKDFVLTAAHCWGRSITVILGAHDIRNPERTQQVISVKRAIRHPDYQPKVNDIMLLQLQREAKLTAAVSLLSLPKKGKGVEPGRMCSVAGWGRLGQNTNTSKLHEVNLKIQKDEQCISLYKTYRNATQICVGDPRKNKSAFAGDSGGPLVCGNKAQGIVSFGRGNGKPPHVETRISSFLPWIKTTMRRFQLQTPD